MDDATLPRWVQWMLGLLTAAFIGFNGFVGKSVIDQGDRLARIEEQLKAGMDDRYRRRDAESDFRLRDAKLTDLDQRLGRVEERRERR